MPTMASELTSVQDVLNWGDRGFVFVAAVAVDDAVVLAAANVAVAEGVAPNGRNLPAPEGQRFLRTTFQTLFRFAQKVRTV
jgi:hypothetical protein